MEIILIEEIFFTGDRNTGNGNTGYRNTGDRNTGDGNTGNINTGNVNTGYGNTGYGNTGYGNTGNRNTGNINTGNGNTGNGNTGYRNTGNGNATDKCPGYLCCKKQPVFIFDKKVKDGVDIPYWLIEELSGALSKDEKFDIDKFLVIPNATKKVILALHSAHIARRKDKKAKEMK